jgi:NAD(P)-dependent dehydrogenase (short-subunit alcohol dehydrogenase family)
MNVALAGLEPELLERAAAACGERALAIECDVTELAAVERAAAAAAERFGSLDAVVANAGIASTGFVRSIDPDAWARVVEVNLLGTFRTIRGCLPRLVDSRGYALLVSSRAAALHSPGMSAYAASKAGVEALADSLRAEVGHLGVDVGCAYFSLVTTDMVSGADAHPVTGSLQEQLKGPLAWRYPPSAAAEGLARGVERRSRRVLVPGWLRLLLALRPWLPPLVERGSARAVADADAVAQREAEQGRVEELSLPLGEGGRADARAR